MTEEKGKAPEDTEQKSRRPGGPQPDPKNGPTDEFYLPDADDKGNKNPSSQPNEAIIDDSIEGKKNDSRGQS